MITNLFAFAVAAVLEIVGCFAFWMWLRQGRSWTVAALGVLSLIGFALALTRVDAGFAGRAYSAYGGVYIVASVLWLWVIESQRPDRWDVTGATVCLIGAGIILLGPRLQ